MLVHEDCVRPKGQPTGVFPAILDTFAAEDDRDEILSDGGVLVVNSQAAPRRRSLPGLDAAETWLV